MIWLLIFLVLSVLQHIHATVFAVLVMESSAVSEELEHLLMIANLIDSAYECIFGFLTGHNQSWVSISWFF